VSWVNPNGEDLIRANVKTPGFI